MTASRNNLARPPDDAPRTPLAEHECYCGDLSLPHSHQLGDHPGDLTAAAEAFRAQQRHTAAKRARRLNRSVR